jgi:CubicO group peptidase (beta-lactamase class C family)
VAEKKSSRLHSSAIMKTSITLIILIFCFSLYGQNPGKKWNKYQNPKDAGFSIEKLAQIKTIYDSTNAKALMVISHGNVVVSWGDVDRRYKCHSMRKSLLSALYGIYVKKGIININESIGELEINDKIALTDTEKTAKISDLLKTRSGIYLPAALEEKNTSRPKRGSHLPGTYLYYNNWDFNVLGSIFIKETKKDIFKSFYNEIAKPIGMQDFRIIDGTYEYEDYSIHPGYPFKMSARDLARFGQLYLQNGQWSGKQIIDKKWIKESITPYTIAENMGNGATGYGYLWWIQERPNEPMRYFALGWGEQYLGIFPELDLVIVIRSDSYFGKYLDDDQRQKLINMILSAKTGSYNKNPELIPLSSDASIVKPINITQEKLKSFVGTYNLLDTNLPNINTKFIITHFDNSLIIDGLHFAYKFKLIPIDRNTFFVEDINLKLNFDMDKNGIPINPKFERCN